MSTLEMGGWVELYNLDEMKTDVCFTIEVERSWRSSEGMWISGFI